MHYVDEGERGGEIALCLHGEPTWGYLFRDLVPVLSRTHRVIVPDHMGFGKSETPPKRSYWLQDHIDNLERLVLALDLRNITLIMHDFGGPVGMGLAARHPDRIGRVISINGPTPFGQADLPDRLAANAGVSPWFQWIIKAAGDGSLEPVLGQLGFNILSTMKLNGFEDNAIITDRWLEAYAAPFKTPRRMPWRDRLGKRICDRGAQVRGARPGCATSDPHQARAGDLGRGRPHPSRRTLTAAVQRAFP